MDDARKRNLDIITAVHRCAEELLREDGFVKCRPRILQRLRSVNFSLPENDDDVNERPMRMTLASGMILAAMLTAGDPEDFAQLLADQDIPEVLMAALAMTDGVSALEVPIDSEEASHIEGMIQDFEMENRGRLYEEQKRGEQDERNKDA